MFGLQPCPTFPEYVAAEAGVVQWVRVSAPLLQSKENITINAILMGPVVTPVFPGYGKAWLPEQ
jgi:NAD(P)-dependent dehydrogenase (short-subunit alcohol dehydrogenase family)